MQSFGCLFEVPFGKPCPLLYASDSPAMQTTAADVHEQVEAAIRRTGTPGIQRPSLEVPELGKGSGELARLLVLSLLEASYDRSESNRPPVARHIQMTLFLQRGRKSTGACQRRWESRKFHKREKEGWIAGKGRGMRRGVRRREAS